MIQRIALEQNNRYVSVCACVRVCVSDTVRLLVCVTVSTCLVTKRGLRIVRKFDERSLGQRLHRSLFQNPSEVFEVVIRSL